MVELLLKFYNQENETSSMVEAVNRVMKVLRPWAKSGVINP